MPAKGFHPGPEREEMEWFPGHLLPILGHSKRRAQCHVLNFSLVKIDNIHAGRAAKKQKRRQKLNRLKILLLVARYFFIVPFCVHELRDVRSTHRRIEFSRPALTNSRQRLSYFKMPERDPHMPPFTAFPQGPNNRCNGENAKRDAHARLHGYT